MQHALFGFDIDSLRLRITSLSLCAVVCQFQTSWDVRRHVQVNIYTNVNNRWTMTTKK